MNMVRLLVVLLVASVTLTGSGSIGAIAPGWQVVEECTPVALGDSVGSVSSASVTAVRAADSDFVASNGFVLEDDTLGSFAGRVVSPDMRGLSVTLAVVGVAEFLNATVTCPPGGQFTEFVSEFGSVGTADGQMTNVGDVVFDSAGNVFVADRANYRIQKFVPDGDGGYTYSAKVGAAGTGNGQFGGFGPVTVGWLAVDASDRVYATDPGNNRVQRFTNNLVYDNKFGTAGSGNGQFTGAAPTGIAIDSSGNIYVADSGNSRIQKFDSSMVYTTHWGSLGSGDGQFPAIVYGVGVDASANVYVADRGLSTTNEPRIQKFNSTGTFLGKVGSLGSGPGEFSISTTGGLYDIDVTSAGTVLATDVGNNRVQKFDSDLNYLGQFGSYGEGPAQFRNPRGLAVSDDDVIAVADYTNNRIQLFTSPDTNTIPLSEYFQTILDLCATGHTITWSAANDPDVVYPAWAGNAWVKIKELCAVHHIQIGAVGDQLTVTDIGDTTLTVPNKTVPQITPTVVGGAHQISVVYQNTVAGDGLTMYEPDNILTVDITTLKTLTIQTTNYPTILNNPLPVDETNVGPGQYYVIDSTGTHVPAATWLYYGGGVFPTVGDRPGQIKLTLQGPRATMTGYTGPFSLASGVGVYRQPELSITGSGVTTTPVKLDMRTGADPSTMTQPQGPTINSPFVTTITEAYDRGGWAVSKATGVDVQIVFDMPTSGMAGFGTDKGSLVSYNDNIFRVTNVKYGKVRTTITAVRHFTNTDMSDQFSNWNYTDMRLLWDGYSYADTKIRPLATLLLTRWLFPAETLYPSTALYPGPSQ